eukprot:GGOE01010162.1.p1 GENE.GGOE01010162.1~~GGOE01010162.1.p1  ORF type:complete len:881 (-),score=173.92 GGOE01010162.1:865-3249(-)
MSPEQAPSHPISQLSALPNSWALVRHAARWLVLPALSLVATLVGLFFLEEKRPSYSIMLLCGCMHGFLLCYFGLALCLDNRELLARFLDSIQPLMTCSTLEVGMRLSADPRLRCLQLAAYDAQAHPAPAAAQPLEDPATVPFDPLHFLLPDISANQSSMDGHVITDTIGTILWCNEALSRYFKYQHGALLSENIRILIPPPYNALHDSLMLKYDRTSSTKKVVGCCRPVPVVDREGRHSKVRLTVEERRDPMDEANVVFLGKMVWPKEPELHVVVQRWVAAGSTMLEACKAADSPWDDFLLVDAHDTILYANAGVCAMLGWHREELQGQPLAVLMDPEVGKSHGGLVQSYIHRSGGDQLRGECTSTAVGKSRDLYARCRRGHYIRTWLSVHRIDATSRKSTDCCFIGTMVHIQGHAARSSGPLTPHRPPDLLPIAAHGDRRDSYSIPAPSHRAARRASSIFSTETTTTLFHYTSTGKQRHAALSGVCWKRCTVVAFDFHSTPQLGEAVGSEYEAFISLLVAACSRHTAVMHTPLGNRVLVSLNFAAPNLSQRSAAGLLMDQVLQGYSAIKEDASELRAAAACGEAMCAMYHRQPVILGDLIDNCDCMLAVAAEARVERGLIDPTLFEELQYAYNCRLINVATLSRANSPAKRMLVYELHAVKQVDENEWMYQIEAQHRKDPLASWRGCWDHLLAPVARGLPPDYAAALTCLDQHIAECSNDAPPDAPTLWLRTTLRQRLSPPPSPVPHPAVLLCSRGRCVIHYSVAPDHTGEVEQFHATDPNATSGSEPLSPKG